jgi:hypothetical protein
VERALGWWARRLCELRVRRFATLPGAWRLERGLCEVRNPPLALFLLPGLNRILFTLNAVLAFATGAAVEEEEEEEEDEKEEEEEEEEVVLSMTDVDR